MFHFLLEITYKCLLDGAHIRRNTCLQNYRSIILGSLLGVWCLWCISVCSNQYTNLWWASLHYGHTHWIIRLNVPSLAWDDVEMFTGWSAYKKEHMSPKLPFNNSWKSVGSLMSGLYPSFLFSFHIVFVFRVFQSVQTNTQNCDGPPFITGIPIG